MSKRGRSKQLSKQEEKGDSPGGSGGGLKQRKTKETNAEAAPLFKRGTKLYALNPKYKDGTRLRAGPAADAAFNGVWLPNDSQVEVLDSSPGFVLVAKQDGDSGWIRERNLSTVARASGIVKGVVSNELVTPDAEYVRGMKIYNCGIKEDPVPGQKFGKGLQHLISSQWLNCMAEFSASHYKQIRQFVQHAETGSASYAGYDFFYFTNMANHLFNRADALGLKTSESVNLWMMATWLIMAAAEVDEFPFSKYTKLERTQQRSSFYETVLRPPHGPGTVAVSHDDAKELGAFAAPLCRRDLLPPVAMERLGINNELSALKYKDPAVPLREGFMLSTRVDSLKRHFDAVHQRKYDEDHIIHLLWNFHAILHVLLVFPDKNDLIDYSSLSTATGPDNKQEQQGYQPTTSLMKIEASHAPLESVLKLDWNEGVIPPPRAVSSALIEFVKMGGGALLKWYPHLGGGEALRSALAQYCSVIPENLLVTNGSDDALILLCQTYLKADSQKKRKALAPCPTYEHFCVNAVCAGATLIRHTAPDPFTSDPEDLARAIEEQRPDLVYLVSPNNPTGVEWAEHDVESLACRFPQVMFIVDEAYYEFGTAASDAKNDSVSTAAAAAAASETAMPRTCAQLAVRMTNVVVTRTFSKAFCLASVRCGYLIAHPNTVEAVKRFYNPKSVNSLAQIAALNALQQFDTYYKPYVRLTNDTRRTFLDTLRTAGVPAFSGGAGNFVCVRVGDAGRVAKLCGVLESKNVYVRDITGRFPGYVRITVGLDMDRVADAVIASMKQLDDK